MPKLGFGPAYVNQIRGAVYLGQAYTGPSPLWLQLHAGNPGNTGMFSRSATVLRKVVPLAASATEPGVARVSADMTWTTAETAIDEGAPFFTLWTTLAGVVIGDFYCSGRFPKPAAILAGAPLIISKLTLAACIPAAI